MKIDAKMDPKSNPKIDVLVLRGHIFEIWGGFLRSQIFNGFLIGEKSVKNLKFGGLGRQKAKVQATLGQGRRQRRWPREAFGV